MMFHSALLAHRPLPLEQPSSLKPARTPQSDRSSRKHSRVRFEEAESRELSSQEAERFSLEEIKTRVKSQVTRYLKTMGRGASSR